MHAAGRMHAAEIRPRWRGGDRVVACARARLGLVSPVTWGRTGR